MTLMIWKRRMAACVATGIVTLMVAGCAGPKLPAPTEHAPPRDCPPGYLMGAGSTAQQGVLDSAIAAYGAACRGSNTVEYDGKGSGDGVTNFVNGLTHFAGTDTVMDADATEKAKRRCNGNEAWHLPMVVGPIALAHNVEGVDDLVLTPEVVAKIFNGEISHWNDAQILALNPGANLPSQSITVVHRSDASGTTENFTAWLNAAAGDQWASDKVSKNWKGSGEGAAKSDGVATQVQQTPGAITYVESSYAEDYKLPIAGLETGRGVVQLDDASVAKTLAGAQRTGQGSDMRLRLDPVPDDPEAYPLVQVTYEVVCSAGLGAEQTEILKDFLGFMAEQQTQEELATLGYVSLPEELNADVRESIDQIRP